VSEHLDVIGQWLRDGLLPAALLLLGGALLIRFASWDIWSLQIERRRANPFGGERGRRPLGDAEDWPTPNITIV
jgi:hypothetical protein